MRDNVRQFLDSLRDSQLELALCRERVSQLEAAATRITSAWSNAPVSEHGDPHKDGTLTALADAREKLLNEEKEYAKRITEVNDFIGRIESVTYRAILTLRYVNCMSWPSVMEKLPEFGIYWSDRQVYYLHGKALNAARKLWAQEKGEEE